MIARLPTPPGANRIWRVYRGSLRLSAEAKRWSKTAFVLCKLAGFQAISGPVEVRITLHPRLTKSGRASKVRLDTDAAIKLTLDALQGLVYPDDHQVVCVMSRLGAPIPGGAITVEASLTHAPPTEVATRTEPWPMMPTALAS